MIDKFRTLHLAHFPFLKFALHPPQRRTAAAATTTAAAVGVVFCILHAQQKQNTTRERGQTAAREREHKRAQLTRRGGRLCYVFYCCFLSFSAVVIAPRPSLCTRQELNAI